MGWSAEEGFSSWLKSALADMSVVQPALHVSLNRLRSLYSPLSMNPEGESIKKPDDEDEDGSKDIDTEDIDSDKTEGDELKQ